MLVSCSYSFIVSVYILRVHVKDLAAFLVFSMNVLMKHPSVIDMRSSFALQKRK